MFGMQELQFHSHVILTSPVGFVIPWLAGEEKNEVIGQKYPSFLTFYNNNKGYFDLYTTYFFLIPIYTKH